MINDYIGKTPLISISDPKNNIYLKYEGSNILGSSKDRAAAYVIEKLLNEQKIDHNTVIVESTSGNMGVALAGICKLYSLKCICVIDPNILPINEFLIKNYGAEVIKVHEKDENNSYLTARINKIKELRSSNENTYWFNQYESSLVVEAYEKTIGKEIIMSSEKFDYIFIAVSSMGTIAGVSRAIKEYDENIKIIAVDVNGSKIFQENSNVKRYLSGIGSNMQSINKTKSIIDDVIIIDEKEGVKGCYELLRNHLVFAGGSSGCVYFAMKDYVKRNKLENKNILCLLNDKGERYVQTIYNNKWLKEKYDMEDI